MTTLYFLLCLAAAICLALTTLGMAARFNLLALGLLLFVMVWVLQYGRAVF